MVLPIIYSAFFILSGMALWYALPLSINAKKTIIAVWIFVGLAAIAGEFTAYAMISRCVVAAMVVLFVVWWRGIEPSNERDWADDVAHHVTGAVDGDHVTLFNVRNFEWRSLTDYDEIWETRHYDLTQLKTVDLFLSTWGKPDIAHTLVSFGFADGNHITFSVEIRKEKKEKFSEVAGFFKQYEIALIAADESDIIYTRTNMRGEDVSLYRVDLTPEQSRSLFLSYVERANSLAKEPEFYHTVTANCTTVVFDMIRLIVPTIPMDYRILMSGRLPSYIYDLGGLGDRPFDEIVKNAPISERGKQAGRENFSERIRNVQN